MESKEQKLLREALEEQNQQKISDFKSRAKALMSGLCTKQQQVSKLILEIESDKKTLREMKLEQVDEKDIFV